MKAEHRKELETNTLAEGMGQLVRRVKERPRRSTMLWVGLAVVVLVGLFLAMRFYQVGRSEQAEQWLALENGDHRLLLNLIKDSPETPPGKAALLERSWIVLWEEGIKLLGQEPKYALAKLDEAYLGYSLAAKNSEGDPVFEPEALFGMAVIEETRAVRDSKKLNDAKAAYEKLQTDQYKNTAYGKMAKERLDLLKDPKKYAELASFYRTLEERLRIQELAPPFLPKLAPPPPAPKGKEKDKE